MTPKWLVLAGLFIFLSACGPSMQQLDADVERMLRESRDRGLGDGVDLAAHADYARAIDTSTNGRRAYRSDVDTHNPDAGSLPARTDRSKVDLAKPPDVGQGLNQWRSIEPASMKLQDTLGFAIAHSREYRSRKEQLYIAALNLLAERHLWGPRFFESLTAQFEGSPSDADKTHALEIIQEFRATKRLPYGGSVSASALVNFIEVLATGTDSSRTDGSSASLSLSVSQPLLRGFGKTAQEDLIQAERDLIYAARAFERFRREFLVDVSTSYYDLLRLQANIENLERQYKNFDWLARRVEALAKAGREPFFEVQRAQQEVLFSRNNLLNAREDYSAALDAMKLLIGMDVRTPLTIVPEEVVVPAPALDPEQSVETAWQYRLDLQTVGNQVEDAKRGVDVARNLAQPDLTAFASLNVPTDAGESFGGANFSLKDGSYTAGVRFQSELPLKLEKIRERQALIGYERAKRSYSLARDQVATAVRQSIRRIQQARFTLALQERNIELAEKRLRGVVLRLRSLGPRDFIEAQDRLLDARTRRDRALRDLRVNVLGYLLDTGQMRVTASGQWEKPAKLTQPEKPAPLPDAEDMIQPEKAVDGEADGDDADADR